MRLHVGWHPDGDDQQTLKRSSMEALAVVALVALTARLVAPIVVRNAAFTLIPVGAQVPWQNRDATAPLAYFSFSCRRDSYQPRKNCQPSRTRFGPIYSKSRLRTKEMAKNTIANCSR